jgi:zinc protease
LTKATETAIQKYRVGIKTNGFWLGSMSKYNQYGLPTENINNVEARVKAVTPAMLTEAAKKYLSSSDVLHALMMPTTSK